MGDRFKLLIELVQVTVVPSVKTVLEPSPAGRFADALIHFIYFSSNQLPDMQTIDDVIYQWYLELKRHGFLLCISPANPSQNLRIPIQC